MVRRLKRARSARQPPRQAVVDADDAVLAAAATIEWRIAHTAIGALIAGCGS